MAELLRKELGITDRDINRLINLRAKRPPIEAPHRLKVRQRAADEGPETTGGVCELRVGVRVYDPTCPRSTIDGPYLKITEILVRDRYGTRAGGRVQGVQRSSSGSSKNTTASPRKSAGSCTSWIKRSPYRVLIRVPRSFIRSVYPTTEADPQYPLLLYDDARSPSLSRPKCRRVELPGRPRFATLAPFEDDVESPSASSHSDDVSQDPHRRHRRRIGKRTEFCFSSCFFAHCSFSIIFMPNLIVELGALLASRHRRLTFSQVPWALIRIENAVSSSWRPRCAWRKPRNTLHVDPAEAHRSA